MESVEVFPFDRTSVCSSFSRVSSDKLLLWLLTHLSSSVTFEHENSPEYCAAVKDLRKKHKLSFLTDPQTNNNDNFRPLPTQTILLRPDKLTLHRRDALIRMKSGMPVFVCFQKCT